MIGRLSFVDDCNLVGDGAGTEFVIDYEVWGSEPPSVVMLHDGLGSIAQWRGTPEAVADRLGVGVLAYNRPGHGRSLPTPDGPWPTDWLYRQARLLDLLLDRWGIDRPLLVGHSDGGSIALLHAIGTADRPGSPRSGAVVALAAHSFVESVCVDAIAGLVAERDRMAASLARFHAGPEAVFDAWSGVWLSDDFARWDMRPELGPVDVPVRLVQGDRDQFGSEAQLWTTHRALGPMAEAVLVPDVGHLIHHDRPELVVEHVAEVWAAAIGHASEPGPGPEASSAQRQN